MPKDNLLGHYVMWSIPEEAVPLKNVRHALDMFPGDQAPHAAEPVDAFKLACRSIETLRNRNSSERRIETRVDQVYENHEACVYQVTNLVRDKDQRLIEHPKSMRITFNKGVSRRRQPHRLISFEVLGSVASNPGFSSEADYNSYLADLEHNVWNSFEGQTGHVHANKLRTALRRVMDTYLHAVNIRKRGAAVYFVPIDRQEHLDDFETALGRLYPEDNLNGELDFHTIPCLDEDNQRNMVHKQFEASVVNELDELISELAQRLRSSRKVRSDKVKALEYRRMEIAANYRTYHQLLTNEFELIEEKLEILADQIGKAEERDEEV